MVVAHLLGEGAPALARLGPKVPLLTADRLVDGLAAALARRTPLPPIANESFVTWPDG
jgi:hypothetical protein